MFSFFYSNISGHKKYNILKIHYEKLKIIIKINPLKFVESLFIQWNFRTYYEKTHRKLSLETEFLITFKNNLNLPKRWHFHHFYSFVTKTSNLKYFILKNSVNKYFFDFQSEMLQMSSFKTRLNIKEQFSYYAQHEKQNKTKLIMLIVQISLVANHSDMHQTTNPRHKDSCVCWDMFCLMFFQ